MNELYQLIRTVLHSLKWQRYAKQCTFGFACCILVFPLFSFAKVPKVLPIESQEVVRSTENQTTLKVEEFSKKYSTERYEYSVEYPTFAEYPDLTNKIKDSVQTYFTEFDALSAKNYQALLDTMTPKERMPFEKSTEPLHTFFVRWDYGEISNNFISIKLEISQYVGGANGITFLATFNWDSAENRLITIKDIPSYAGSNYTKTSWLEYLSKNSRILLENKTNPTKDPVNSAMMQEGTAPIAKNFEDFTLKGRTITIWFEEYAVAAGSFGILFVTLPLEE